MDTSALKPFAQQMRTALMEGVRRRLRYWGFEDDGTVTHEPEAIEGGYIFRGEVHGDERVPKKWRALKNAVARHSVDDVVEEAAYTWFNRLIAICILEKSGHAMDALSYAPDTRQPTMLYNARQGILPFGSEGQQEQVNQAFRAGDDDAAFRTLLVAYCNDHDLLKDVFGRVDDFTELLLPTGLLEREGPIERLVTTEAITDDDFAQVELIGWLYQFYISEKKDAVYDAKGKFRPEDIPAATQIFTPRWIVRYMVENTLGRLWLDKYPDSPLRDELDYLVESEDYEPSEPLFDDLSELKLFDPAAGSGHILVVGFELLMKMYRERGYTDREAVEQILAENLKGLEVDRRAAQLARFALLMKAAQYDRRALDRAALHSEVYAMPEPRRFSTGDLRAYLGDDVFDAYGAEVKEALDLIAEHGQNVGSALKLDLAGAARTAVAERVDHWDEKVTEGLARLDEQALHEELRGYLKPLLLLTDQYPAVAMNPPYVSKKQNMNKELDKYVSDNYPRSKWDLFAVFTERGTNFRVSNGLSAIVTRDSWMFQSSYDDFREWLFSELGLQSMIHLGTGAFVELEGEVVRATAFTLSDRESCKEGVYHRLVDYEGSPEKRAAFLHGSDTYAKVDQRDFKKMPGVPVAYWMPDLVYGIFAQGNTMSKKFKIRTGLQTGDNDKFLRAWYEPSYEDFGDNFSRNEAKSSGKKWFPYNKGGEYKKWYGNRIFAVDWKNDGENIKADKKKKLEQGKITRNNAKCWNQSMYFKESLTWSSMSTGPISVRLSPQGALFDTKGPVIQSSGGDLHHALGYLNSACARHFLSLLAPSLDFNPGALKRTPYLEVGKISASVKEIADSSIQSARRDWDSRETSWDFTQHPLVEQSAASLEEAYGAWRRQATDDFFQLHANEEELNRLFINLYEVEGELRPRVAFDNITILEDELDRSALAELDKKRDELSEDALRERLPFKIEVPIRQFLSYGIGVMLGRYRLGRDGLHIAHPNPSSDELAPYEVSVPLAAETSTSIATFEIDDDAILPLMGSDSPFSDDAVYRMREIVRLVWGEETLTENLNFINHALSIGRSRGLKRNYEQTMEAWLVGDFWDYHKSLYKVNYYGKKPIYWLFASPEGHFQVLVYMHRMNKYTVQQVRQNYLHKYQQYLRSEIQQLEAQGEDALPAKDAKRLDTLRQKAADCRDYDAILKDIADRQIEIDLDDGVQENYPLFGEAVAAL